MFIRDMTESEHLPAGFLAVGWLTLDEPFPQGPVRTEIVDRLFVLAQRPVRVMRGFHNCELCDRKSPIRVWRRDDTRTTASLGFGEIHVSHAGRRFSAPTLLIHYILSHGYKPPEPFLEAVEHDASL